MSRIPNWKIEKTKVKVVFRLHFHATHVPQGWDKLFISFVPVDLGKVTAKTTRATVRNGNCKWSDPIYETAKLIQDPITKIYDEKLYRLAVAMGTSRSSILGEAVLNLADHIDALKPSSVSLPLHGCDFGTNLHVNIQLLTSKTGFREFELQREFNERSSQIISGQRRRDHSRVSLASNAGNPLDKDKVRVTLKTNSPNLVATEKPDHLNASYEDTRDGSSNTSGSLYAEKIDFASFQEIDCLKSTTSAEIIGSSLGQSSLPEKGDPHDSTLLAQGSNDWTQGWSLDYSMDNDLAHACAENDELGSRLEKAESFLLQLKLQANSLQSVADELGAETHNIAKQLVSELAYGSELHREVSLLKSECLEIKKDISVDQNLLIKELQKTWIQGLALVEFKVLEIQNKVSNDSYGCDFDFDVLKDMLETLKCNITTNGVSFVSTKPHVEENFPADASHNEQFIQDKGLERSFTAFYYPEGGGYSQALHGHLPFMKNINCSMSLEDKIGELLKELEKCRSEKEDLTRKMGQMECYYEGLIQELEESHKQKQIEFENLRIEHGSCLYTIATLEGQIEKMQHDMSEQFMKLAEDKNNLDSLCKSLEKRAMGSETALRRVRWNYSIAVDRLQKDLELLSFQVLSMYETNENLAKQALSDDSKNFSDHYTPKHLNRNLDKGASSSMDGDMPNYEKPYSLDFVQEDKCISKTERHELIAAGFKHDCVNGLNPDSTDSSDVQRKVSTNVNSIPSDGLYAEHSDQHFADKVRVEDLRLSVCTPHSLMDYEDVDVHFLILHLEIYSKVLQETLHDVIEDRRKMEKDMDELAQDGKQSAEVKEPLIFRLQHTYDEARNLRENEAKCISRWDELVKRNQSLETDLQVLADENNLLTQRTAEYQRLIVDFKVYESKYRACNEEMMKIKLLLEQAVLEKTLLQAEMNSTLEDFKAMEEEFAEQSRLKDDLQNALTNLQEKLRDLYAGTLEFGDGVRHPDLQGICWEKGMQAKSCEDIVLHLEQFQQDLLKKLLGLLSEIEEIKKERDSAHYSLRKAENESALMKEKFELELQDLCSKLGLSNTAFQNLALDHQDAKNKLDILLQGEEMHNLNNMQLCLQLQDASDSNKDLLLELDKVKEELEETKLSLAVCMQDKRILLESIKMKEELLAQRDKKLGSLEESLKLMEEERAAARHSVRDVELEFMHMKQKLNNDIQDLMLKLSYSSSSHDNLEVELQDAKRKLKSSLELQELQKLRNEDLSSRNVDLENKWLHATEEIKELGAKISALENASEELEKTKSDYVSCMKEKEDLLLSVQAKSELLLLMEHEISSLKESQKCLNDQLQAQKESKMNLDLAIADATTQLKEKSLQLQSFDENRAELMNLRKKISDLEFQRFESQHTINLSKRLQSKQDRTAASLYFQLADVESLFLSALEHLFIYQVESTYLRSELGNIKQDLLSQLGTAKVSIADLTQKHAADVALLQDSTAREAELVKEISTLSTALQSVKYDLIAIVSERDSMLEQMNVNTNVQYQLDDLKAKVAIVESDSIQQKHRYKQKVSYLKNKLVNFEKEVDCLRSARDELDVLNLIFKAKLDEQQKTASLLEEVAGEVRKLKEQNNELSYKLSEQILKTEEFKNLSIHLREQKDKAETECQQARVRKESEASSVAMQESLRIALIKEQCELKVQELKNQLGFSKKHAEEMLVKLQNAVSEVESGKKNEMYLAKRNEELSTKMSDLDKELQVLATDRRELVRAYDRMKAELECTMLSLDCFKDEKAKLETSLQECNEDRTKITVELDLVKRLLENMTFNTSIQVRKHNDRGMANHKCIGQILDNNDPTCSIVDSGTLNAGEAGAARDNGAEDCSSDNAGEEQNQAGTGVSKLCSSRRDVKPDCSETSRGSESHLEESLSDNSSRYISMIKERSKEHEMLRVEMDHICNELERLKNENLNSLIPLEDRHLDLALQGLERELTQLEKANEHLGNLYPSFKEIRDGGNALERVLALELELAESLQEENKPSVKFQSSFLKQHNNEAAVYQSFRDINELIKDMLELKKKNAAVETELKEMHDRYSQLSLQFAEVEGERQKLLMTLKNRSPRKS